MCMCNSPLRSRRWFGTLNNPRLIELEDLRTKSDHVTFISVWQEEAPTTGTPHYHILIQFDQPKSLHQLKLLNPRADWEVCRGTFAQAYNYISKGGDCVYEKGKPPRNRGTSDQSFKQLVDDAKRGCLDTECIMYARHRAYFDQILIEHHPHTVWNGELPDKNIWIHGPPGTGKSRMAHLVAEGSTLYVKLQNKWWDGFYGQKYVLIEDLDPKLSRHLGGHFKNWADRYSFTAEVKGGARVIDPTYHLIVTSNYTIRECFEEGDVEAIERRFDVLYLGPGGEIPCFPPWN